MRFDIPQNIQNVLAALERNGFEAFLVGGCVRDTLLRKTPGDYDITTNAAPEQMLSCLGEFHLIETGLKHGTVTAISGGEPVEITAYRVDGVYLDHRRPESIRFTPNLREDLARRDFTVNAMAYSEKSGLIDFYGGEADLKNKVLRCVGEPSLRFFEDALRILRALRFSAVLGFELETETARAVFECKALLSAVSAERIAAELEKLLLGEDCFRVLTEYAAVLAQVIPEITPCVGFEQHNKYHRFDVWGHSCAAVSHAKKDRIIRLAMLLHDIAKPECFTLDEKGQGHFYTHEKKSAEKAAEILRRLRFDRRTAEQVKLLIENHYFIPSTDEKPIKRALSRFGADTFFQLLEVQRADAQAKQSFCLARLTVLDEVQKTAEAILARQECLKITDLAVRGEALLDMGFRGKSLGEALQKALEKVLAGELPNERTALLTFFKDML